MPQGVVKVYDPTTGIGVIVGSGTGVGVGQGFSGSSGLWHGVGSAVGDGCGVGVCSGTIPDELLTTDEPMAPVIRKAVQNAASRYCLIMMVPAAGIDRVVR